MSTPIFVLIVFVVLFHVFAFCMESLFWQTPRAMRMFGTNSESAAATRVFALNQGFYNLFLAAGLVWSLVAADPFAFELKVFFLSCVVVAGVVGGLTVSKRVLMAQAFPALIALMLTLLR